MKTNNPILSIVMVDGSFRENYYSIDFIEKQTLPNELYEILWVEYFSEINSSLYKKQKDLANLKVLSLGKSGVYHSSYCFNAGIIASKGEIIVIMDADLVVEEDFLESIYIEHEKNRDLVLYIYRFNEPQNKHTNQVNIEYLREICELTNPLNHGGCSSARRNWFMEINGYEQHQIFGSGFHANGLDVSTRFKNLGLYIKWHPKVRIYHPWHPYTLIDHPNYITQIKVIDHRARNLITLPFEGIDKKKNTNPPKELIIQDQESWTLSTCLKAIVRKVRARQSIYKLLN